VLKSIELLDLPGTGDSNVLVTQRREKGLEEADLIIIIGEKIMECDDATINELRRNKVL